ncbi:MAG: NADH-quinone oxidoreductase subunit L [Anaerolineales bacterium]|nr:NADH-quinone oxidoreductase subunit L [Anaerolineales bacterium]
MLFTEFLGAESAWFIPAISASSFLIILLFGRFLPGRGAIISIVAVGIGLALFWPVLKDVIDTGTSSAKITWFSVGDTTIRLGMTVDLMSVAMLGLITLVSLLVQIYSVGYMRGEPRYGWYFALHGLFAATMTTLVLADNLLFLYFAWELVGLCSYLLIGFWFERKPAAEAAKKAFITTRVGDVALLIGIIILFNATGHFEISTIIHVVEQGGVDNTLLTTASLLIFIGAMGKSAQFPLHVWLPDAMEGPTPVSALIHAATMVAAGIYLVARVLPIFEGAMHVMMIITSVGTITFLLGSTLALVATDIKRILAYSTISHLGIMMLSLGSFGAGAAILHLIAHGLSKALLFLGAGSVMHSLNGETSIWKMGGLRKNMPITTITFLVGAASLAGIAPLSGFFSKDEILIAVADKRGPLLLATTFIGILVSSVYIGRLSLVVFFGKPRSKQSNIHESPLSMTIPLITLAIMVVCITVIALPWGDSYKGFVYFLTGEHKFHFDVIFAGTTSGIVFSGLVASWFIYGNEESRHQEIARRFNFIYRIILNGYYFDRLYQWLVNNIVLAASKSVSQFDRIVINDTGVDQPAAFVMISAVRARYLQTGKVYNYGAVMAVGVSVIITLWWLLV